MGRKDEAGTEGKPEWKIWRGYGLFVPPTLSYFANFSCIRSLHWDSWRVWPTWPALGRQYENHPSGELLFLLRKASKQGKAHSKHSKEMKWWIVRHCLRKGSRAPSVGWFPFPSKTTLYGIVSLLRMVLGRTKI